ncbi:S41 family peptidase [Staphylococcus auricularis]|uniref:S41 family peptidase n=1 Tax=Staphylococcus auricularis TaxID=29379 RepID=UPI001EF27CC6|nr:S41 family peptidase [Staphylococcus auricularis]MCG7340746.1 S41 family peptidase [Staphylococcus auricularis]
MKKIWYWLIGIGVLLICGLIALVLTVGPYFNLYIVKPSPEKYAKIALNQMDANGLYAKGDQWEKAKEKALNETKDADSYKATHKPLERALSVAGGKHSFIMTEEESDDIELEYPKTHVDHQILTIELPGFMGNQKEAKHYAEVINDALQKGSYKGVIVDLQDDDGGDMGPMIGGLSSLIPDGKLVSYIDQENEEAMKATLEGSEVKSGGTPIKLSNADKVKGKPVAILLSDKTASSGEITALSFKGLKDVKYFGDDSATYTSVNSTFTLYDGTMVNLTTHKLKDRTGKVYENDPIKPDEKTKHAKQAAKDWLKSQINQASQK